MTRSIDSCPGARRLGTALAALALAGCLPDATEAPRPGGSGGFNAGGTMNTGGALPGSGGTLPASGGSPSGGAGAASGGGGSNAGGASGGAIGQGGAPTGGSGGALGSGGVPKGGSGGAAATGGRQGGGGSGGSGGAPGSGGASGSGGSSGGGSGGTSTLWKPTAGTTWQWQLTGTIDTSVNVAVYDIDGFDADASLVKKLHDQGRKVICYLSVGSFEDWRPDAAKFPASVLGRDYPGWPGEKFVDIRAQALRDVMAARFDMCRQKGFDGIEPDNMDVYSSGSGFPLTERDGIDYANWMATEAHKRGLNIGQKNASEISDTLQPTFDWVLTEDCYDQDWCAEVQVYVDHDKPVFMSEYTDTGVNFNTACSWGKPKKYSPILKGRDLDAPVTFCP